MCWQYQNSFLVTFMIQRFMIGFPMAELLFNFVCFFCDFLRVTKTLGIYRQWTHIRTYGTDVFAMDMLSSISQVRGDKLMKPMAFYCVFILVLRRLLPDF